MEQEKKISHEFGFIIFIDPTYKQGWVDRKELPKEVDAIHIGCGVVVKRSDKAIWFAFAEELRDVTSDVMHPQMIHWDCVLKLYTFEEELFDEIFKSKTPKRITKRVRREVDEELGDYFS